MPKSFPPKSPTERLEEARSALQALDPGCGRTEWIKIAAAAKAAGIGEDEFVSWSSQAGNFDGEKSCRNDYRALKAESARGGRAITADTLFRLAYDVGWQPPKQDARTWTPPAPSQLSRTPPRQRPRLDEEQTYELTEEEKAAAVQKGKLIGQILAKAQQALPDHPYLQRKQIGSEGLLEIDMSDLKQILKYTPKYGKHRQPLNGGRILIVPLHEGDGKPVCLEFIDYEGHKSIIAGFKRHGTMWTPEPIEGLPRIIYITEGVATAYTAWICTSEAVVGAGAKNNLGPVAKALRSRYTGAQIIVLSDAGEASEADARIAAEAVWGHSIAPDPDALPEGGTDFNDMACYVGESHVTHWILRHSIQPDRPTLMGATSRIKIDYVLPGLEAGTLGLIVGAGAVGKTFLALELAMSISLGRSLPNLDEEFWVPGKQGSTALVLGEDSYNQLNNRLFDISEYFQMTVQERMQLDREMLVSSLVGRPMELINSTRDGIVETTFVDYLMHICSGRRIVFIDPMARLHDADENDNTAITKLFVVLSRIARLTNCSIVILHHFGKGDREGANAARGASAISTSARWQVNVSGPSKEDRESHQWNDEVAKKLIKVTGVKMNYGPMTDNFWLRRAAGGVLVKVNPEIAGQLLAQNDPPYQHGPAHGRAAMPSPTTSGPMMRGRRPRAEFLPPDED